MSLIDTNPYYAWYLDQWELVRDCVAGSKTVKEKGTTYLPDFVPTQGEERYDAYKQGAVFVNFVGDTKGRLVGAVFRKDPEITIPSQLDYMMEDCTGNGLSIFQFSKSCMGDALEVGRGAILVDYPEMEERENAPSIEDVKRLELNPYFGLYKAESIYNWRVSWRDGKEFLTQVRLKETEEVIIDEFTSRLEIRYRVLDIDDSGYYRQRIFDEGGELLKEFNPRANGKYLDYIPFFFFGSETNTATIDQAPLYDLAVINIAHYRNSADYEEAVHIHGQGTLLFGSSIDQQTFEAMNPNGIQVGSRAGHFLGPDAWAMLLQMDANSSAKEAMDQKEAQMKEFGVELFGQPGRNQTAEEARLRASSESNSLNTVVDNVSEAIEMALVSCSEFLGVDGSGIEFRLNREFFMTEEEEKFGINEASKVDLTKDTIDSKLQKSKIEGSI